MSYDDIVVGGGIVGASVAYHLARRDRDVLLVDRADEGRATDAGAGIVSAVTSSRAGSDAWFRFGVQAAEYYPRLAERLRDDQDGVVGYDRPGILAVAADHAEVEAVETALKRIRARQDRLGVPRDGTVTELSSDEARGRFPLLTDVESAFVYERAGRIDGRTFTDALLSAARNRGLDIERESVERIVVEDGAATGVVTDETDYSADAVVVAGGAWSSGFGDDLGNSIPVEPMRGQIVHFDAVRGDAGGANVETWPMVKAFRGHYLVPWSDGRIAAGATREEGSGFDPRTTAAGVHEVLDEALRVAPGLGDASLSEVRVGLRPASPDGLPVVGPVPEVEGAYVATGHGPTGLTLGPYSGRVIAELIAGEKPKLDLEPFAPGRFG